MSHIREITLIRCYSTVIPLYICSVEAQYFYHFQLHNNFDYCLDGLWDVLSNANVYETTKKLYDQDIEDSAKISDNLCHNLVKKLVIEARGVKSNLGFWHMSCNIDQLASGDDITCLALPITKANDFLK